MEHSETRKEIMMDNYGKELILDLHECDPSLFNRDTIKEYFEKLCELIDMEACDLHFWDDVCVAKEYQQTNPQTKGTSAIQFILTSNIIIHTLDLLKKVFVNVFSCKDFDSKVVADFTAHWFHGKIVQRLEIKRL